MGVRIYPLSFQVTCSIIFVNSDILVFLFDIFVIEDITSMYIYDFEKTLINGRRHM